MPLIAHSALPSFQRMQQDGQEILSPKRALSQDIRELHIGLLNMMPDAALEATERQFLRLIGSCNRIAQFYVHFFSIEGVERDAAAQKHLDSYYERFADLQRDGLDALVITGANITEADITAEPFWDELIQVVDWAKDNVSSTFCSCLASHAVFKHFYGISRVHLDEKQWGVYSHRVQTPEHPLLAHVNTRFDTPHSRFNDVSRQQMEAAGMKVLVYSEEGGVLVSVSPDQFRFFYFQGHPEYDSISLLKEYKREIGRFVAADRNDYPPFPEHYFSPTVIDLLDDFRQQVVTALSDGHTSPELPEQSIIPLLDNTWADTGKALFNNWLGLVYQVTNRDRKLPFMDGVDADDPLSLTPRGVSAGPAQANTPVSCTT